MFKPLKNRKWQVLSSEYLLREGAWCTVRCDRVQLPNGVIIPNWYVYEFPNWANIIAITKEGKIGKQKYSKRMKLSVHQAASYVIARKGQGYSDRLVS